MLRVQREIAIHNTASVPVCSPVRLSSNGAQSRFEQLFENEQLQLSMCSPAASGSIVQAGRRSNINWGPFSGDQLACCCIQTAVGPGRLLILWVAQPPAPRIYSRTPGGRSYAATPSNRPFFAGPDLPESRDTRVKSAMRAALLQGGAHRDGWDRRLLPKATGLGRPAV